jgi:hypothetical protein
MVPVAPIITGITLVFKFHMRCISIVRYYYYYYYYVPPKHKFVLKYSEQLHVSAVKVAAMRLKMKKTKIILIAAIKVLKSQT